MSAKSISLALIATLLLVISAAMPSIANATVVRVETVMGDFEINLYDNAAPSQWLNWEVTRTARPISGL